MGFLEALSVVPRGQLWGEQVGRKEVSSRLRAKGWETRRQTAVGGTDLERLSWFFEKGGHEARVGSSVP